MKHLRTFFVFSLLIWSSLFAQASKQEKIFLELAWKHQFQSAGYVMAKEKGFYADANLDVAIVERKHGDIAISIGDKECDGRYGIGHSSLVVEIANGKKLKMLFAAFQSSPSVFVALKDSNITNVADFKGKSIMVTNDMATALSLQAMLLKKGLKIDDINVQKHSFTPQSLLDKKTDIMASYISNEPYFLKNKGVDFVIFNPAQEGFDFYSDILFTSQKEYELHGDRATAFAEASIKGWEYAFSHIEESVDILFKKYNTQNKSKDALLYEAQSLKQLAYLETTTFGTIEAQKLQRIYDLYNAMGFVTKKMNLKDFFLEQENFLLNSKEREYLKNREQIKMCVDPNWMPYEKIENGKHVGMSADYFSLLETILETKIELVRTEHWDESVKLGKEKKCDILSLAMPTKERKKYFNFTKPYVDVSLVLATKSEVPFVGDFKLLKKKKIGVTKGFAFVEVLKEKYPNLELVVVENTKEGLLRVVNKDLFGYAGDLAGISYNFQKYFGTDLKISGQFEDVWSHSIAIRKDDALLFNIFEKALANISEEQKQKIQNRWISIYYDEQKDYTFLWWVLGILATAFGIVVFLFWEQKKINAIVEMQAARDYMTKLYNRRYFTESSKYFLSLARRDGTQISIVIIDIDDFKKINDTYGHTAGDETIKALAKVMLKESRKSDMVARWGGEEFVILLPGADTEGAKIIAEKIKKATQMLEMKTAANKSFGLTISLGVSMIDIQRDLGIEAAIIRADKALYEAKKSGKNRVRVNVDVD